MALVYYEPMEEQVLQKILSLYGIETTRILPMQTGYRNQNYPVKTTNETLNLIIYKSEPGILMRIKNANQTAGYLADRGMPARRCHDERIAVLKSGNQTKYASIYQYLPGATIAWEAYTMEHLKALGGAMSTMHEQLLTAPIAHLPMVHEEYAGILKLMDIYFTDQGVITAMQNKLGYTMNTKYSPRYKLLLKLCSFIPGQQPLHMDFVRGNILFIAKTISGILDFEKAAYGHPIFDVARTLAFLLVDCKYKDEAHIRKYFLQSGYNKRGNARLQPIKLHEFDLLEELTSLFLLYDFYKFLCHNPYESLKSNEHFVRTCTILLKRGLITHK